MSFNTSIVVKHMRQIIRSYDPMCFSSFNEADRRLNSDGGQRGGIIGETQKLGGSVDLCMSQRFVGLWPFSAFQPNFTPKMLYKPDFDPAQYMFQPKMTLFTKPISLLTILLLFFTFHCILYQYSFILHWERATGSLRPSSSFFTGTERLLLVWVIDFFFAASLFSSGAPLLVEVLVLHVLEFRIMLRGAGVMWHGSMEFLLMGNKKNQM